MVATFGHSIWRTNLLKVNKSPQNCRARKRYYFCDKCIKQLNIPPPSLVNNKRIFSRQYVGQIIVQNSWPAVVIESEGQWAIYYSSPQSFIIMFSYSFTSVTLVNFDWLVQLIECLNISTTNFNLQKKKFCVSSLWVYINLSAIVLSL